MAIAVRKTLQQRWDDMTPDERIAFISELASKDEENAPRLANKVMPRHYERWGLLSDEIHEILHESLDNARSYVNIQSEGEKKHGTERGSLESANAGGTRSAGTELHESMPTGGIQGTQKEGQTTESPQRENRPGTAGSGEHDSNRDVRPGSVESGNPPEPSGLEQRLTPSEQALIPGAVVTSKPRDIDLNLSAGIGNTASPVQRWNANINALRVLKIIENDKRQATPEEQAILANYSGFGDSAFGQAFDPKYRSSYDKSPLDPFEKRGRELQELVTPEEFNSIKASRTNAFYTTPEVVKAMWAGLDKMGATKLQHPRILEPSAGSGRFLGYEPTELAARSIRTAVEKDTLTGKILKYAYPDTTVHITGFEDAPIPDNSQDIAISNVPFGNIAIHDNSPEYSKKSGRAILKRSIHNYFFAKSLDKLRPGGVLAFVTSHNTLDAPTAKPIRELLADQADFISATRLPNNAFGDTKVVTDIIFMRKRIPGEATGDRSWIETTKTNLPYKVHSDYSYRPDETYQKEVDINSYFVAHPENILGKNTIGAGGGMYGQYEYTVEPLTKEPPTPEAISNSVNRVPSDILKEDVNRDEVRRVGAIQGAYGYEGTRHVADDGSVVVTRNNELAPSGLSAGDTERVKGMLVIRDAGRNVLNIQLRDGADAEIETAQKTLNSAYDKFTAEYGALSNPRNAGLIDDDPDAPFLRALEKPIIRVRKDTAEAQRNVARKLNELYTAPTLTKEQLTDVKMPLFNSRVVKGLAKKAATTDADAAVISLNETGRLDLNRMGELLGKDNNEIAIELAKQGIIFKNPVGDWEPRDKYLSGDVREKLKTAELASRANPAYQNNVDALREVQPADVPPSQISLRLGTPWVPETDVDAFVHELLSVPKEQTYESRRDWQHRDNPVYKSLFHYRPDNGEWVVDGSPIQLMRSGNEAKMKNEYGTERYPASYLITSMLNGQLIEVRDETGELSEKGNPITERNIPETVAAQAKADIIQAKFREWIWSDPERAARLSKYYNETFNSMKPQAFDGAHMELPGMTIKWEKQIHPHQKDAIWRGVQDRTVLLAHEVGFGKTAVMVGIGMELRRLGLSRKNLFVVPKATHEQFKNQFMEIYPYAKVLFPNEDDFTTGKRGEFIARVATGDWDAIILADSQFRTIEVKPETQAKFLREELNALRDALEDEGNRSGGKRSGTSKDIEKAIERVSVRLKDATAKIAEKHEHAMYFEDLGVDQMFVDEADAYKNLHFATRMGRLKGLPNSDSERAWDMYMKTRNLQQGKGQGVVFATGTPIANTVAEMYTMMRYLQEPMLESKGLQHFDTWAKTFGDTTEGLEQNAAGKYVTTQRFSKFVNIPELNNIWQQTADIRVADEVPSMRAQQPRLVNEKGEKAGRTVIAAPPDQALRDYMVELAERADEMSGKDPREDNMLKLASDARKASLDMRMVKPNAPANPEGKVALAANNIARIYNETTPDKGTQLVFLDLGTPKASDGKDKPIKPEGFIDEDEEIDEPNAEVLKDVYGRMRDLLVAQGIPRDKIAFIHDAKSNEDKQRMYDRVNKGDIRVIIGSTGKLGTGVNVQERAAAVHHLDAPWRPRDIEQREGRIIRQGNKIYGPQKDENGNIVNPGKGVRVYTYVTEGSFDAFMWQAIEAKAKAIKSIMRRDTSGIRQVDDADSLTLSAGQAKAIATGNPDVLKAVTLENDIYKLGMLRGSHFDAKIRAQAKMKELPERIKYQKERIAKMERDTEGIRPEDKFSFTVNGKIFGEKERPDAGLALESAIRTAPATEDVKSAPVIGNYKGFDIKAVTAVHQGIAYTHLILSNPKTGTEYATTEMAASELTGSGAVTRITNRIADIPKEAEKIRGEVTQNETNLKTYQKQSEVPFVQEARLTAMVQELNRLKARLAGEKNALNEEAIAIPPDELLTEEPKEAAPEYHFAARDMPEFKPVDIIEKPIEKPAPPISEAVKPIPQPAAKEVTQPVVPAKPEAPKIAITVEGAKIEGNKVIRNDGSQLGLISKVAETPPSKYGMYKGSGSWLASPPSGESRYFVTADKAVQWLLKQQENIYPISRLNEALAGKLPQPPSVSQPATPAGIEAQAGIPAQMNQEQYDQKKRELATDRMLATNRIPFAPNTAEYKKAADAIQNKYMADVYELAKTRPAEVQPAEAVQAPMETLPTLPVTREQRETAQRLINSYQYHNPETGFHEWKPETPEYVKKLSAVIDKAQEEKPKIIIKKAEIIPTETGGYVAVPIKEELPKELQQKRQALVAELRKRADIVEKKAKELPPEKAKVMAQAVEAVREKADKIEAVIPKAETPKVKHHVVISAIKKPSLRKLQVVNALRSPQSIAQDNSKKHHVTLEYKDKKVSRWLRDPGSADIIKVDTPGSRRPLQTRETPERLGIAPDNGLRSKRRGKIFETPVGRTVLLSRHSLGKRRGKAKRG